MPDQRRIIIIRNAIANGMREIWTAAKRMLGLS